MMVVHYRKEQTISDLLGEAQGYLPLFGSSRLGSLWIRFMPVLLCVVRVAVRHLAGPSCVTT